MRLERLALAPYGRFADRALDFAPDAALHVVYGRNETGKTTTLSAIGDLLFGFPTQTPYGFLHDQKLLRVGGRFRLSDGSVFEARRRKGNKNTLVGADDQPVSEDALARALGSVTRETFQGEFGLTAEALRSGGEALLKAGGGLAETLAASSAGLSALSRLRETLQSEADGLFTARRSAGKPFYLALDRYDSADKRLREAIVTSEAVKAAEAAVLEAEAREVDLKAQHTESGQALSRWRRASRTRAKLARLAELDAELAALGALPLVDAAELAEWRAAITDLRALQDQDDTLRVEEAEGFAAAADLPRDENLLARGSAIEGLRERLSAVRKAREDLPRRQADFASAVQTLDDQARRLGLGDHEALIAAAPTDAALARAQQEIELRRRLEDKQRDAETRRQRARAERAALPAPAAETELDTAPLRRRLDALAGAAGEAERLRRESAALDRLGLDLEETAARLDPAPAGLDALARLPLPDQAALAERLRAVEDSEAAAKAGAIRARDAASALAEAEAEARRRENEGAGATRADWLAARRDREAAFERLTASLDGAAEERRERLAAARSLSLAADALAESLLADSQRAARLQAAREEVETRRRAAETARSEAEAQRDAQARQVERARALWASAGLCPALREMPRWRREAAALLKRREEMTARRVDLAALAARVEDARAAAHRLAAELGATVPAGEGLEALLAEARARWESRETATREARELRLQRERGDRDVDETEAEAARASGALAACLAEWPAAMQAIGQRPEASIVEAEAALAIWRAMPLARQTMGREQRAVDGITADIAAFESEIAALVAECAPDLVGAGAEEASVRLARRLAERRQDEAERERLARAALARAHKRQTLEARREALRSKLAQAALRLGTEGAEGVAALMAPLDRRAQCQGETAALRRDLAEIADGLDEAALRAEQASLDFDRLAGDIEIARARQDQLMQEIIEAGAATRAARARVEALTAGRNAAEAARERLDASAELADIAERWLMRQAAARLAARAIERHRAAAQDPLVRRAGELFALATGAAFAGLGADYDEADRPVLVALRAGGERVKVEGLSEGARDQLFLALRLALLERRAGEPLPFIGDDILASFDDARTAHTLNVLADFGRGRQAIVFTHHRHVADLAEAARAGGAPVEVLTV